MIGPRRLRQTRRLTAASLILFLSSTPLLAGITITPSNGIVMTGADGIVMTGADGIVMTGADGVLKRNANGIVMTGADGAALNGFNAMAQPNSVSMTRADGIVMTGADGLLPGAIRPPSTGLRSVDPELALQLTQLADDSTVNAVVIYHRLPSDSDLADLQKIAIVGGTRFHALPMITAGRFSH